MTGSGAPAAADPGAPAGPGRILALGVPPRAAAALARAAAPPGAQPALLVDVAGWNEAELEGCRCGADDVFLVWTGERGVEGLDRARPFRARHAGVPALARVPAGRPERVAELLRAGFLEVFSTLAQLPEALVRARARMEALRKAEPPAAGAPHADRRLDTVVPNVFDWIYVVGIPEDGQPSFETVNPPLDTVDGFLRPEFEGKGIEACLPERSARQILSHVARVLEDGHPVPFEEEHPVGGKTRIFQTILTPVRNKWGRIHRVAGISRDVTALKEALAALRASEERLNHALEGTQQGLWDWDLATGHVYRSPRWFEMVGLAPGGIEDTFEAGLVLIHPEDLRQLEGAMNAHLEGRLPRFQAEYRIRSGSGEWTWIFDAGKVVAWDLDGRPARVAGMCTDITERRRAEEALRALVGGVVHEIRNPVYGIFINLDALEATFGEEPRYAPFVAALRESAGRISSLMNDLRDYGEPRTLNPEPTLVRSLVDNAVRACDPVAAQRGCRVDVDLEDPALLLPLNGRRIHQVFRNLLENALQHAPAGSTVSLAARRTSAEGHDWWTFTVTDGGPGFDGESLARAFEPFFTRRDGGTGLGLSIVKRVVEEHGGSADVANHPQGGGCVTVRLPAPRKRPRLTESACA